MNLPTFHLKDLVIVTIVSAVLIATGLSNYQNYIRRQSRAISLEPIESGVVLEAISDSALLLKLPQNQSLRISIRLETNDGTERVQVSEIRGGNHVLSFFLNRDDGRFGYCIDGTAKCVTIPIPVNTGNIAGVYTASDPDWAEIWYTFSLATSEKWAVEIQLDRIKDPTEESGR